LGFFVSDARSAVELIGRADQAGVDTAWMVMHPAGYDTPTLAAAALAATPRIRVGTSIVPALTRHPVTLATQVVVLAELHPGRFRLGIGTSNLALLADGFGTPVPHPIGTMREYLDVLHAALDKGVVDHQGSSYRVDIELIAPPAATAATAAAAGPGPDPGSGSGSEPMPVTLAALGPRMFELAGERADAALSWLCPPDYLDAVARPAVARGAARAGRPAPPIVTHVMAVVATGAAEARSIARPAVEAFGRNRQYAAMFAGAGFPVDDDGTVSDGLLDAVTVHGDEAELTDRLGDLAEQHDELLVTLQSPAGQAPADHRADEDVLLRVLAAVSERCGG
jgi:alkanesulfonate monooxygenase SsuD/methylene tetrahydromethanopterin reductase-like flavin-dependent oxidoreductase (luciferase family)